MFKNITQLAQMLRGGGQMAERLRRAKADLGSRFFQRNSKCGTVVVEMNGLGHMKSIRIANDSASPPNHVDMEIIIAETVNEAIQEARRLHIAAIRQMTGDIQLPGLDQLLNELND